MIDIKEYPYTIKHSEDGGCGNDALYIKRKILNGEILYVEDMIYLDGTKPKNGDVAICGSCGDRTFTLMAEHVVLREVKVKRTHR